MIHYKDILRDRGLSPSGKLLSLDPGHTTGWSVFQDGDFVEGGQIQSNPDISYKPVVSFINQIAPDEVVMEKYTIYQHKLKQHAGSDVPTLRLIGALELIFEIRGVPITYQTAAQAKGFCDDKKLKAWGLWKNQQKHYHDSLRHALYYLLFSSSSI